MDSRGQTIDFLLAARRDTAAAKRFFRKALAQPHTVNPRTLTVDKNPAYPRAVAEMKRDGELWRRSRLRQCKYLNNIVEQDHRRIKRLVRPGLGFGGFRTARRTLAGFEAMAMIRKGQIRKIGGRDIQIQVTLEGALRQCLRQVLDVASCLHSGNRNVEERLRIQQAIERLVGSDQDILLRSKSILLLGLRLQAAIGNEVSSVAEVREQLRQRASSTGMRVETRGI